VVELIAVLLKLAILLFLHIYGVLYNIKTEIEVYLGIQIRELQALLYLASIWYMEGLRHPFAAVIELHLYP